MTTAADLYALQETDVTVDRLRARLAEIEEGLGETEELVQAREQVQEKKRAVTALRSQQGDLELRVEEVRSKAAAVEKKLYGGAVRNPKELEDLQTDLNLLQAQTRKREDALLSVLVDLDEAEARLREAESALSDLESRWKEEQRALEREKAQAQPEVERLEQKRSQQASGLDAAALNLYRLLRERRGGQAVARVEQGMCQGCRITLPMSVLQKARAGLVPVQCVSCERILLVS